jgi:hypothetical protein
VRQGHNLDVIWMDAVGEQKGKVAKRYATNGDARRNATHCFTDDGMRRNQIDCGLNLRPQAFAQSGALILVPLNIVAKLFFGFVVRPNR